MARGTTGRNDAFWSLAVGTVANAAMIYGVLAQGWPPGNVWLAFWLESICLGVVQFVRIRRIERAGRGRKTMMGSVFWAMWYGGFTGVQGVFVIITAVITGVRPVLTLWIPVTLVLVRTFADLADIISRPAAFQPFALVMPITRMITLHLGVIAGFGVALSLLEEARAPWRYQGISVEADALPVLILLGLKQVAELIVGGVLAVVVSRHRYRTRQG